ncbi:hypothetical protein JJE00_07730, partial [Candidatus Bathyarchaeota archaeon]|nr:hypothetical protein [Candidatus Bathyarchaeota archaeon]
DTGTPNLITAIKYSDGVENSKILSPGETVVVKYSFFYVTDLDYSAESGILKYTGPADSVTINAAEIPEFPIGVIIPVSLILGTCATIILRKQLRKTS